RMRLGVAKAVFSSDPSELLGTHVRSRGAALGRIMDLSSRRRQRVFLFAGHGGQTFQMARVIYDSHPGFKAWMDRLDLVIGGRLGRSVLERLYRPSASRSEPLREFQLSHPAIFMVEYALARALMDRMGPPDLVLGA